MKKDVIKVIKRVKNEDVEKTKDFLSMSETKIRHKIGNVVNDWISERRENRRIEKLFSESNILAWQKSNSKVIESASAR